jgi:heme oxygenase
MTASALRERQKPESFRFTLRTATRSEHAALDAHPALSALVDGTLSPEGYRRLMSFFYAFYDRHDSMLRMACSRYELERLGFVYAQRRSILLSGERRATLPSIRSSSTLAGYLYVLEGSMLGGGVLLRAAEAMQRQRGESGFGYWQWCHDAGAARWRMTCNVIDILADSDVARSEIIEAARQAFSTFSEWLEQWRYEAPRAGVAATGVLRC